MTKNDPSNLLLLFSPPLPPPSRSYLAHERSSFNVGHAGVKEGTGNQRKGSEKDGRRSVFFFLFLTCALLSLLALSLNEREKSAEKKESKRERKISFSFSFTSLFSQINSWRLDSIAASPRRRDPPSPPKATMQGALSGVPLARRAACAPSPSARGTLNPVFLFSLPPLALLVRVFSSDSISRGRPAAFETGFSTLLPIMARRH